LLLPALTKLAVLQNFLALDFSDLFDLLDFEDEFETRRRKM
jgi:hypothetical protein